MLRRCHLHHRVWTLLVQYLHLCIGAQLLRLPEVREPWVHLEQHLYLPWRQHMGKLLVVPQMRTDLASWVLRGSEVEIIAALEGHLISGLTIVCRGLHLLPDIGRFIEVLPRLIEVIAPAVLIMLWLRGTWAKLGNRHHLIAFRLGLELRIHKTVEAIRARNLDRCAIVLAV